MRAESVVLPGTLILLVFVFGSVVAASLPLLIGVPAVAGTMLVLSALGLYPAVPEELARLRFFITCSHTPDQIRRAVTALEQQLRHPDLARAA